MPGVFQYRIGEALEEVLLGLCSVETATQERENLGTDWTPREIPPAHVRGEHVLPARCIGLLDAVPLPSPPSELSQSGAGCSGGRPDRASGHWVSADLSHALPQARQFYRKDSGVQRKRRRTFIRSNLDRVPCIDEPLGLQRPISLDLGDPDVRELLDAEV